MNRPAPEGALIGLTSQPRWTSPSTYGVKVAEETAGWCWVWEEGVDAPWKNSPPGRSDCVVPFYSFRRRVTGIEVGPSKVMLCHSSRKEAGTTKLNTKGPVFC